jgi:hypothetical protein
MVAARCRSGKAPHPAKSQTSKDKVARAAHSTITLHEHVVRVSSIFMMAGMFCERLVV